MSPITPARTLPFEDAARGPRSGLALIAIGFVALVLFTGFLALGNWQWQRRAWKHELIARVDSRIHADPVPAPGRDFWTTISADDEYLRVRAEGEYLADRQTLVAASTDQGSGYWVMTPLRTPEGSVILINRGFVPPEACKADSSCEPANGRITVTGLLRNSQTYTFLRSNDVAHERWYSRDVRAIAAARNLADVAPYFVDADAVQVPAGKDASHWPQGGMTTVSFANNHVVYMLTWYALAVLVAAGSGRVFIEEYRLRRNR